MVQCWKYSLSRWAWWYGPVISATGEPEVEKFHDQGLLGYTSECNASPGNLVRPCLIGRAKANKGGSGENSSELLPLQHCKSEEGKEILLEMLILLVSIQISCGTQKHLVSFLYSIIKKSSVFLAA